MRKYIKKLSVLFVLLLGLAAMITIANISPESKAQKNDDIGSKAALLNARAKLAKGGDEKEVGRYADEVFQQFGSPEMATGMSLFKDRLVRAEVNYRRQGKGGVSERSLAKSLNGLTKKLGAPDYARISPSQVRYMRVNMMIAYPGMIHRSSDKQLKKSVVDPEMSPLEAAGMTMLLVTQKLSNKEFQVTPEEWAASQHEKQVKKWEAHKKGAPLPKDKAVNGKATSESARSKELQRAFYNKGAEILPLIDSSLQDMGIPR
jgi:hypothetical protein